MPADDPMLLWLLRAFCERNRLDFDWIVACRAGREEMPDSLADQFARVSGGLIARPYWPRVSVTPRLLDEESARPVPKTRSMEPAASPPASLKTGRPLANASHPYHAARVAAERTLQEDAKRFGGSHQALTSYANGKRALPHNMFQLIQAAYPTCTLDVWPWVRDYTTGQEWRFGKVVKAGYKRAQRRKKA